MGHYIPHTDEDRKEMLETIGLKSLDDLYQMIPDEVRIKGGLNLPEGLSEMEVRRKVTAMADKNKVFGSIFRGAGAYNHFIPATVGRIIEKESFLTSYTPYQAEISQGVLQYIFEYQTMICDLTGMDVSNACVYDGAEAAAEACQMCRKRKREKVLVSEAMFPDTIETIKTYCHGNQMEVVMVPAKDGKTDLEALEKLLDKEVACAMIQHPNYFGNLEDAKKAGELIHEAGAKFVMSVNPISLGVLKTPREYGADVAVGEGQPLGLPMAFGGPYLGFMACVDKMMRQLPGRIVGETVDDQGRTGYVLTLQAREQHIRREKASSNICSNQSLNALAVGVYLSSMGNEGIRKVAVTSMSNAHYMAGELEKIGFEIENKGEFFHEFVTRSDKDSALLLEKLESANILGGLPLDEHRILWCCTEMNNKDAIDEVVRLLKEV